MAVSDHHPFKRSNHNWIGMGLDPFFFVTMYFILLVMGGPRLLVNNNKPIRINELDSCCYSCWPSACHWVLAKHNLASIVVQQMVQCLLNWIFPHFNICTTAVMLICATDIFCVGVLVGVERALVKAALCCWSWRWEISVPPTFLVSPLSSGPLWKVPLLLASRFLGLNHPQIHSIKIFFF